jgi:hypothetical protein
MHASESTYLYSKRRRFVYNDETENRAAEQEWAQRDETILRLTNITGCFFFFFLNWSNRICLECAVCAHVMRSVKLCTDLRKCGRDRRGWI